jgi:hypothetical protein
MNDEAQTKHAQRRRNFAAAIAAMLMMFSMPSGAANPAEREYDEAVRTFRAGRMSHAFGKFIDLANRGDVDSARIALFLHSYGPVLFGKQWDAGEQDVAYWNRLVRNSGTSARPLPEFAPTVLTPSKAKSHAAPAKPRAVPDLANVARN